MYGLGLQPQQTHRFKHLLKASSSHSTLQALEVEGRGSQEHHTILRKPYHSCRQWSLGFTAGSGLGQNHQKRRIQRKGRTVYGNIWPKEDFKNQGKKRGYLSTAAVFNGHRTVNTMGLSTLETREDYRSSQDWREAINMNKAALGRLR